MKLRPISDVLKEASEKTHINDRVAVLQANDTVALRTILKFTFDPAIQFELPKGALPAEIHKPDEFAPPTGLHREARRLNIFIKGNYPDMRPMKREGLFFDLINSLTKEEAHVVLSMKDKQAPYNNITEKLVRKAFPDLIP